MLANSRPGGLHPGPVMVGMRNHLTLRAPTGGQVHSKRFVNPPLSIRNLVTSTKPTKKNAPLSGAFVGFGGAATFELDQQATEIYIKSLFSFASGIQTSIQTTLR